MGRATAIEWADHTFNPWWGCVEVSPACDHCYARTFAKRTGHAVWGKEASRRFFGEPHWADPLRWHRRASATGGRERVFCASMGDVLEERADAVGRQLDQARQRLWETIARTPSLDWLLLTKRPAAYRRLVPLEVLARPNVWAGTTVESEPYQWRVHALQRVPARVRFLSIEPLLGPMPRLPLDGIAWVIVGGESGGAYRAMHPDWARGIRDQCRAAGVAFFFKQWGGPTPKAHGKRLDGREWCEFPAGERPGGAA